jgi:regulator of sirC expression with transglutaminase-like and TPR domain
MLFKVRDALIHIKAIDQAGPPQGEMTTFTMPDFVMELQRRHLAKASNKDVGAGWLDALETDRMASWACDTALNMMLAVLSLIPDGPGDPSDQFKHLLRLHKNLP